MCVAAKIDDIDHIVLAEQLGYAAYDQWRNFGKAPTQPAVLEVWDDYVALLDQVPEDVRHQVIHRGHNCWVVPEEERFVTRGLIEASCMVGTADELVERLHA